jgi:hypothetical protein
MNKSKSFLCAALAAAATLAAGTAQAGTPQLRWSITIGSPGYVLHPVPVYVRPLPVYPRGTYWRPTRWDRDGDGIPNRQDRLYNPRWDRDGDRVPNLYDRSDDRRWPKR